MSSNSSRPKLEIIGTRPNGELGGVYDIIADKLREYERNKIFAFPRRYLGVVTTVPEAQSMLATLCDSNPIGTIEQKPSCVNWKIQQLYPSLLGLSVYAVGKRIRGVKDEDSWTHQFSYVANTTVFHEETGKLIATILDINRRIKNG